MAEIICSISGTLFKDAELSDFNGRSKLTFSLPHEKGYGDKKKTIWVNVTLWGDYANKMHLYLKKDVIINCILSDLDIYTHKMGNTSFTANCNKLQFLGNKASKNEDKLQPTSNTSTAFDDDDIPF